MVEPETREPESAEPQRAEPAVRRCGFIALIGAPNVGKSTLINAIVGAKVAIVSHKVQTTRTLLRGIATDQNAQLVFIDTPGIFQPRRRLDRAMVAGAWTGAGDADIVAAMVDAKRGLDDETVTIAASSNHFSPSSELANSAAAPDNLVTTESGKPIERSVRCKASTARPSDTPSARLKEMVVAGNSPWCEIKSGAGRCSILAKDDSGTAEDALPKAPLTPLVC